jgi:methionyl aminopeptidase
MSISTEKDLEQLKKIGLIVADCLQLMASKIEPGMTTKELDQIGAEYLATFDAKSAPILVYDFPGTTCISIIPQVAHGIPGEQKIKKGDLINIDVSAELNGFFADTGGSFIVPPVDPKKQLVCDATKRALRSAIQSCSAGKKLNLIGKAIEIEAKKSGLTIIENLGSHGVGRGLHEEPKFIPGYFDPDDNRLLKENMVITIEPFLSTGAHVVEEAGDGWTLITDKKFLSAQYEHTLLITKSAPQIITLPTKFLMGEH